MMSFQIMYKAQYKTKNPFESWKVIGSYPTEDQAMAAALMKKRKGALLVRVIDKKGSTVYTS